MKFTIEGKKAKKHDFTMRPKSAKSYIVVQQWVFLESGIFQQRGKILILLNSSSEIGEF